MAYSPDLIANVPQRYLQPLRIDRIVYSPSLRGEVWTGPPVTLAARTTIAALTGLVFAAQQAIHARSLAESWRDYKVGATAAMVDFDTGSLGYLSGYNVKPSQNDSATNLHAEQVAVAKGHLYGLTRLVGIAINADPQCSDANPLSLPTLRPCKRCVDMLEAAPEVDERTLVLGTAPDLGICEIYPFGSLTGATRPDDPFSLTPFSLKTEGDLETYDNVIQPQLIGAINDMYGRPLQTA